MNSENSSNYKWIWYTLGIVAFLCGIFILIYTFYTNYINSSNSSKIKIFPKLVVDLKENGNWGNFEHDGRTINLSQLSSSPKIVVVKNFMSADECDQMIQQAEKQGMNRSTVQGKTNEISRDRTSHTTNFTKRQNEIISRIENRASTFLGIPLDNMEPLQVCRYQVGQQYKHHYDFFVPGKTGTDIALKRGGQRTATIFVYLNNLPDGDEGGHTDFPKINLKVKPEKGTAVFWPNVDESGKEDFRVLHAGMPPQRGTKYGMNIWFRSDKFV